MLQDIPFPHLFQTVYASRQFLLDTVNPWLLPPSAKIFLNFVAEIRGEATFLRSVEQLDQEILNGIRQGESKALGLLYKQHYPRIAQMVRTNSGTEDDARDLFQDAVMVLYGKARSQLARECTLLLDAGQIGITDFSNRVLDEQREFTAKAQMKRQLVANAVKSVENNVI